MAFMAACLLKLTPLVSLAYPFYFSFLFLMLVIAFIDFDTMLILNVMTYPAMIIYFLLLWVLPFTKPVSGILGFLVGTLSFILTAKLFYLITKKEGLGMGDVKLMGVVGLVTGVEGVIVTIFLGSLLGAVLGLLIRRFSPAVDGETHPRAFPFGPFLCLGAVTYLLYGQEIVNWYVQTFWAIPV